MQDDISKLNIEFYRNFELSKYCTWRSGCLADYIFYPKNLNDLFPERKVLLYHLINTSQIEDLSKSKSQKEILYGR